MGTNLSDIYTRMTNAIPYPTLTQNLQFLFPLETTIIHDWEVGERYVTTKFSRMYSLPNFFTHGAPQARALRARDLRY